MREPVPMPPEWQQTLVPEFKEKKSLPQRVGGTVKNTMGRIIHRSPPPTLDVPADSSPMPKDASTRREPQHPWQSAKIGRHTEVLPRVAGRAADTAGVEGSQSIAAQNIATSERQLVELFAPDPNEAVIAEHDPFEDSAYDLPEWLRESAPAVPVASDRNLADPHGEFGPAAPAPVDEPSPGFVPVATETRTQPPSRTLVPKRQEAVAAPIDMTPLIPDAGWSRPPRPVPEAAAEAVQPVPREATPDTTSGPLMLGP
jgi:hypothetical protein